MPKPMKLHAESQNIVTTPELHDGFVESLSVNRQNRSAELGCRTLAGQRTIISFLGVRALCGNDFRQGNIIGTLWLYQGRAIPSSEISSLLFGENLKNTDLERLVEDIHRANEYLVKLWCSYGLELKVLCKEIDYENIE